MAAEDTDSRDSPPAEDVPRVHTELFQDHHVEAREQVLEKCVALQRAALNNDWETAKRIIKEDEKITGMAITTTLETSLHVATSANHIQFVEKLVRLMDKDNLTLKDCKGNTAFCYAALAGALEIAMVLMRENEHLPLVRGCQGLTPLYLAACSGHAEMASFLYPITKHVLDKEEWIDLFFTCIHSQLYDLAFVMLETDRTLAVARDFNQETALHVLAQTPSAFDHQSPRSLSRLIKSTKYFRFMSSDAKLKKSSQALHLVRGLWKEILHQNDLNVVKQLISTPSRLLLDAAELGNFRFLVELIHSYPDLIWERDEECRTIFHIAVLNRHEEIFNLIYNISPMVRHAILTYEDSDKNNILHLAATLPSSHKLKPREGGTMLQFRRELLWFKAVKEIVQPSLVEKKNSKGLTPKELFTITHETMLSDGERWIKRIAKSCMLTSAIISLGLFFLVFASNNERSSSVLIIAEAIALLSSSAAMVTFLCILISRYAETDFLYSLPFKMLLGLATFFISVATMLGPFYGRLFVSYPHMG